MWTKPKDKEPPNQDDEYFLRSGGDKYIGWWDNKRKEFYESNGDGSIEYFQNKEFPNIEWWDEQEPNQDQLWEEVSALIHINNRAQAMKAYTLIPK